jgi:hypothetical protein
MHVGSATTFHMHDSSVGIREGNYALCQNLTFMTMTNMISDHFWSNNHICHVFVPNHIFVTMDMIT